MNIRKRLRAHPDMHTGALNDILFILLLFFLIVSTLANPNVVKVNNPKGKADTKAKQTVVISIDKDQQIFLGQQNVSISNLEAELTAFLGKETDKPSVSINADSTATWGTTYRVMQIIKKTGAQVVANVNGN
jgi:biopolymer transport protein ExbD